MRGSICRIVTVSAPVFSSVDCASFSFAAWISMSSASSSRAPSCGASSVIGDSASGISSAPPERMNTSWPSLPRSCFSYVFSSPARPLPSMSVMPTMAVPVPAG